ncbi:hypothetical protein HYC85_001711 [Camellia sinensis]|uniref:Uncharacterized protein n=1 Tax=Camellia sinensis TaxID=4442 RepID=A0A7J7I652_CAMSI|nr:hypothetical protein HYC85_001711 [Camellia sinensis]
MIALLTVAAIANSIESSMITDLHKYESSQIHNPYIDHTLPTNSQSFYSSGYSGHTALVESLLNPVFESRSSWQFNKEFDGFSDLDTYIQRKSHHQRISLDSIQINSLKPEKFFASPKKKKKKNNNNNLKQWLELLDVIHSSINPKNPTQSNLRCVICVLQ